MSYKLLIGIVPHDSGELICNAAKSAGAGGGTIAMGRGTASRQSKLHPRKRLTLE